MIPGPSDNPDYSKFVPDKTQVKPKKRARPAPVKGEFYHEIKRGKMWFKDDRGAWVYQGYGEFAKHLANTKGLVVRKRKDELISETDKYINEIVRVSSVNNVASLAGYSRDTLLYFAGKKILVPDGPTLIAPAAGLWPLTRIVLEGLLEGIQFEHFLWWLAFAIKCQRSGSRRPGQAVFFCGKRNSGKSLLQDLITLWFGGRESQPFRFMSGGTTFNAEVYGAEHARIDDEGGATDIKLRRKFTDAIKEFSAKRQHSVHPKFQDAFTSPPLFIRLTISLNDEPENMTLVPADEEAINDKIIIYKVGKRAMPMPTGNPEEEGIFMAALAAEAPAFLHYLLNEVTIPEEWRCERFGVLHYHHLDITETRKTMSNEFQFEELLDIEIFKNPECGLIKFDARGWIRNITSTELDKILVDDESSVKTRARSLLHWPGACGSYLGRLQKQKPWRFISKRTHLTTVWSIAPPNFAAADDPA